MHFPLRLLLVSDTLEWKHTDCDGLRDCVSLDFPTHIKVGSFPEL